MYKRLLPPIVAASAVILLIGFQAVEHWTVIEHAIEALKGLGPSGEFIARIITSPIFPLVLALLTILYVIEMWREQREKKDHAVETSAKPIPSISQSGNSTAIASPTISPTFSPVISPVFNTNYQPPAIAEVTPPPRLAVDVKFTPWEGQFEKMYLTVTNQGPSQTFEAECRIISRRHDPNPQQLRTYNLQWQYGGRAVPLACGKSDNLLIASAGQDRSSETEWIKLEAATGEHGPDSHWSINDMQAKPEYGIEIKIFGDKSDQPKSERFTVRAGRSCALEMYIPSITIEVPQNESEVRKRECRAKGFVSIPRATVELRVFAGGRWHHNGYATVKGNSWEGTVWFGAKDSTQGEFTLRAIADGNFDKDENYTYLPTTGYSSNDVKVHLNRELPTATLVGEIEQGQFTVLGDSIINGVRKYYSNVRVSVRVTTRESVEMTIKRAGLKIVFAGETYIGVYTSLFDMKKAPDLLGLITNKTPIRQGVATVGPLEFFVEGLKCQEGRITADVSVTLVDEYDTAHVIRNEALRIA